MPTNVFFNNFDSYSEQKLIEDLIIESIRMYGHDLYYCPRTVTTFDETFNEDQLSVYGRHYLIEMYIKNVEGFEGEGDFLSKFNIQLRDEITFTVARRVYDEEIGTEEVNTRPEEGDLIYFPLTGKIYVIKFVEHEPVFYQMGALQMYDLRCELFEYSNEVLQTGLPQIDDIMTKYNMDVGNLASQYANGDLVFDANTGRAHGIDPSYSPDDLSDNDHFDTEGELIIDWSEVDPFSEGDI